MKNSVVYLRQNAGMIACAFIILGNILLGGVTLTAREVYPFFSWSLFSIVPQTHREYLITLPELRGQSLVDLVPANEKIQTRYLAQAFGKSVIRHDVPEIQKRLEDIRVVAMRLHVTRLSLERTTGDPLEQYLKGIKETEALGEWSL